MARRRGKPIHGWLIIDKPLGLSSAGVVGKVRRLTGAAKVGHGGTLDPMASGVLPVALGEATKTVSYAMDGRKVYRFTVRWGESRTTDDAEGEVLETSPARPTSEAIEAALSGFIGEIDQVPPIYSAVKVDGKRAYALARADQPVELEPRRVLIEKFDLIDMPDADHAEFEVVSGKGAYMRSLARDLALAAGTVGHIAALRRTAVGPFREADAISLDKLAALGHSAPLFEFLLPVETALDDIPALALTEAEGWSLRHGQPVAALPVVSRSSGVRLDPGAIICAMSGGKPVALAQLEGAHIRPLRVLNL
ncbi:MAG: tRNA pseudouridine(55) synthase TruB [Rhodospirillales bacterium]|nr:tRNA pseudouridine(55) synthase TruB [Rhodospirillales bacterium]